MENGHAASAALRQMMGGATTANLLYIAVELGLPELLARATATGEQLAEHTGADPNALHRILRGLAALGILSSSTPGSFGLTPTGALLRKGVPGSAYHAVRLMGHPAIQRAWTGLPYTAMTGRTAFDQVHGVNFFAYLMACPDLGERFNEFMSEVTNGVADIVARSMDLKDAKTIVDIGGGAGVLLREVLHRYPRACGTIVDIAALRKQAEREIAAAGLDERCVFIEGDFFATVPPGADVYLLKSVLHDWDDDRGAAILATCRSAMGEHSRLLVVETIMPATSAAPIDTVMSDLIMLTMGAGRERTIAEYTDVFERAGLRLRAVTSTSGGPDIIELAR